MVNHTLLVLQVELPNGIVTGNVVDVRQLPNGSPSIPGHQDRETQGVQQAQQAQQQQQQQQQSPPQQQPPQQAQQQQQAQQKQQTQQQATAESIEVISLSSDTDSQDSDAGVTSPGGASLPGARHNIPTAQASIPAAQSSQHKHPPPPDPPPVKQSPTQAPAAAVHTGNGISEHQPSEASTQPASEVGPALELPSGCGEAGGLEGVPGRVKSGLGRNWDQEPEAAVAGHPRQPTAAEAACLPACLEDLSLWQGWTEFEVRDQAFLENQAMLTYAVGYNDVVSAAEGSTTKLLMPCNFVPYSLSSKLLCSTPIVLSCQRLN